MPTGRSPEARAGQNFNCERSKLNYLLTSKILYNLIFIVLIVNTIPLKSHSPGDFIPVFYKKLLSLTTTFFILLFTNPAAVTAAQEIGAGAIGTRPWWYWPLILFVFCFALGIIAVLAGVGGGVLYVPLVSGFFPFHIDFVRGVGLMVALAGALAAGPGLLRRNLASLRLALPVALIASISSIFGAMFGLYLSRLDPNIIQVCLGAIIVGIAILFLLSKNTEKPIVNRQDALGLALGINGAYLDEGMKEKVEWKTHRTPLGLLMFIFVGFLAGMFGLGAGWANIPVLNLILGVPLKISVATSKFLLSITDTSAAWIYLNRGCVIPLIAIPSILGLMFGSFVGVKFLRIAKPKFIRYLVIVVLFFAGFKAIDKGLGLGILG